MNREILDPKVYYYTDAIDNFSNFQKILKDLDVLESSNDLGVNVWNAWTSSNDKDFIYGETKTFDINAINTITVRFINTVSGKDVIVDNVERGSNLLAVGDNAGISLPRACRTGLCGSCTCEVQDPNAIATTTNPRDGYATLRACSTKCFVPEGMKEMVVDVHRMKKTKKITPKVGDIIDTSVLDSAEIEFVQLNYFI